MAGGLGHLGRGVGLRVGNAVQDDGIRLEDTHLDLLVALVVLVQLGQVGGRNFPDGAPDTVDIVLCDARSGALPLVAVPDESQFPAAQHAFSFQLRREFVALHVLQKHVFGVGEIQHAGHGEFPETELYSQAPAPV